MLTKALEWVLGLLGAVALFAIMCLTFLDVGSRKLLAQSITGSLELTELLMVVVIFSALPLVSRRSEHVVFDSLDPFWPTSWVRFHRMLVDLLCALLMLGLAYLLWQLASNTGAQNETTGQLKIPKASFVYIMALMCGLTSLLHCGHMIWPPKTTPSEGESVAL